MKSIMKRFKTLNIRLFFQILYTIITNGYVYGYLHGKIYKGSLKYACVPGLNCYSCPGALASCPLGALQAALNQKKLEVPFAVLGFFFIFGSIFGRFVCGWLCPFGLLQELIYKIPLFRKKKQLPFHSILKYGKYLVLFGLVIVGSSILFSGFAKVPAFCKYLCPSGTFMGAIPLLSANEQLSSQIGGLFYWKLGILLFLMFLSIKIYRPFCQYLCPLGAIYGWFNRFSLVQIHWEKDACISCMSCQKACPVQLPPEKISVSPECLKCGQCIKECPTNCLHWKQWGIMGMLCMCILTFTACGSKTTEQLGNSEAVKEATEDAVVDIVVENTMQGSAVDDSDVIIETSLEASVDVSMESDEPTQNSIPEPMDTPVPANPYDFTICFAGDINLDENWCTTQFLNQQENGIYDCFSQELIDHMRQADIMCLNNEFTYSTKGAPLEGKAYTFRAKPERVAILQEMGVDIVKLANNHVYDYGKQALLDTFDTLEAAGISYMGAGRNLDEAMEPVYIELDGKTVAFVAASRAEKNKMTPQATEDKPGILRCYDTELFLKTITDAKANADFVIAYVHWGTEYSYDLEKVQLTTGKEYLDAGADVVIGAHSHCLQGMEYYNGKPIIYSLGNYWFNEKTLDTMLLDLHFYGSDDGGKLEMKVIPAIQSDYRTQIVEEKQEQERIYSFLEDISVNIEIDQEGIVSENVAIKE